MPGRKKPIQNDTLTFVNENMTYEDVISIFRVYGIIKKVNKYLNRFFIQFETSEQASVARYRLGRIYRVTYAHAKSYPCSRKNFSAEGERNRTAGTEVLPSCGNTASSRTSRGEDMIRKYVNSTRRGMARSNENANDQENQGERDKELENQREKSEGSKNGQEVAADSKTECQASAKQDQQEKPANPKPSSSQVRDPEHDNSDGSRDNPKEPVAQKRPEEQGREEHESEEEGEEEEDYDDDENDGWDENVWDDNAWDEMANRVENGGLIGNGGLVRNGVLVGNVGQVGNGGRNVNEEGQQAEARALEPSNRRRVRIEEIEAIMRELGTDMSYSVIIANIPERYNLEEVYDLVEEVKPIAFSEMDYSIKLRVKFCEVFVNDAADVNYLKRKLNDFIICGKQLAVMEPAEILDETRWNA